MLEKSTLSTLETVRLRVLDVPISISTNNSEVASTISRRYQEYTDDTVSEHTPTMVLLCNEDSWEFRYSGRSLQCPARRDWPGIDDLLQLLIERERTELLFLHASSVLGKSGSLVFVGASTSGKTTLALAMHNVGFPLLAEDTTPINLGQGTSFPLLLEPRLREGSPELETKKAATWKRERDKFGLEQEVPIECVFFLQHRTDTSVASRDVSEPVRLWEKMAWLVNGGTTHRHNGTPSPLYTRTPAHFGEPPLICDIAPSLAMTKLFRHAHPTTQPMDSLLEQYAAFWGKTKCFLLSPGPLDATVQLLQAARPHDK